MNTITAPPPLTTATTATATTTTTSTNENSQGRSMWLKSSNITITPAAAAAAASSSVEEGLHEFRPDAKCSLWTDSVEHFFRNIHFNHRTQVGPTCVSNVLAMITDLTPEQFQAPFNTLVNTESPVSWSDALKPHGKKLAYCPMDCRRLKYYLPELLHHDDLFTISFYCGNSASHPREITKNPNVTGRVIGSHIILLFRNMIYDSTLSGPIPVGEYCWGGKPLGEWFTKRIFRVVPSDYPRGL